MDSKAAAVSEPALTASELHRVSRCTGSGWLSVLGFAKMKRVSAASSKGTLAHRFLELVSKVGREDALAELDDEERIICEVINTDALPADLTAEVSFAYDMATGQAREIGRSINRDYGSCRFTELPGTADVLGINSSAVVVLDWKTGYGFVDPPQKNWQLRFLGLCASRVYDRSTVVVGIVRLRENGSAYRSEHIFSGWDLDTIESELHAQFGPLLAAKKRLPDLKELSFVEGDWCRHCPHFARCPAKINLLRSLSRADAPEQIEKLVPFSGEQASLVYKHYRRIKDALAHVGAALFAYANEHPIALGDGVIFGPTETRVTESLDGNMVWQLLKERYGQQLADETVQRKATKVALRESLRTVAQPRQLAKLEKEFLAEIREKGGINRNGGGTTIREYTPSNGRSGNK